jgi:phage-related minor tail protein
MAATGELNVNINVDITETIRGLKAIQREAKKAAQALRELEAVQLTGNPDVEVVSGTVSAIKMPEFEISVNRPEDVRKIADKLAKAVSNGGE